MTTCPENLKCIPHKRIEPDWEQQQSRKVRGTKKMKEQKWYNQIIE